MRQRHIVGTLLVLGSAAGGAVPDTVVGQDRSVFSALDVGDRAVAPGGGPGRGALTAGDLIASGGRRIQVWRLDASVGDELQVDLRSGDFDAYLYVVGPGLGEGLSDDDGGDGLNARVCVVVDEPGEYRAVASSLSSETGGYTLQVTERPGVSNGACPEEEPEGPSVVDNVTDLPTAGRVLPIGSEAEGELSTSDPMFAGSLAQAWTLEGAAGQSVAVDLVSDAFDAYLIVQGPGLERLVYDDDGAGRCNSRIELELPETGEYRVVASTLGTGAGPFRLIASEEPGPRAEESCVPPSSASSPARNLEAIAVVGALAWEETHEGTLTGGEGRFDDRLMQGWTLEGRAGERIMVEMRSSDFDSYVYLTGEGFEDPASNDDGAGNLNSRLCVELPSAGTYRVLAGPLSGGEAGQIYTIRASRADAALSCGDTWEISPDMIVAHLSALPTEGRTLALGGEARGRLEADEPRHPDTGDPLQAWSFQGVAGRTVYVDVVSEDFDAVLYAVGAGIDGVLYIDDAGEGCNSRMSMTPSASGAIVLLPGSFYDDATGAFLIRSSENPPPLEVGGCGAGSGGTAGGSTLADVGSGETRTLQVGTVVSGSLGPDDERLSSGEPAQAWAMRVRAGDELVIDLVSEDFDPVLYVDGTSLTEPLRDDDSLGDQDSRIELTAAENGTLRLVVSAYAVDGAGAFELSVVRRIR